MTVSRALIVILLAIQSLFLQISYASADECVVLLHGWAKSGKCMIPIEQSLTKAGYKVQNITYPTRYDTIEQIAQKYIDPNVKTDGCNKLHFVAHSLGGIVTRHYIQKYRPANLGRVVLIGSPSNGNEIIDKIGGLYLFKKILGPAALELSTDSRLLSSLEKPNYEIGVISGDVSLNPITSLFFLPGPDDGIVTLESTKIDGMTDQITIPATHVMILKNNSAHKQIECFLRNGSFCHE